MPAVVDMSSTPHGAMDSTPNDKKRNKLGYHRTSVACGRLLPIGLCILNPAKQGFPFFFFLFSSLPSTQDPLSGRRRRCPRPLRKLYSSAQGVPVLPRRPTTAHREEIPSEFPPGIRVHGLLFASDPQRAAVASSRSSSSSASTTTTTSSSNGCSTPDPISIPADIRSVLCVPCDSHDGQSGGAVCASRWFCRDAHITISRLVSSAK